MSKSDTFESDLLKLLFENTDITSFGDSGGLRGSASAGSLYVALHSSDPSEAGDQTTGEVAYTSYARVPVSRSGGFVVTGSRVNPAATITFPSNTGVSTPVATHFSIGTASSGAGRRLYSGPIVPTILCAAGVAPQLTNATEITED